MAENNVQRKIHKPIDGSIARKLTAPIHRTTSETIRLNNVGLIGNLNDTSSSSLSPTTTATTTTTPSSLSLDKSHLALSQLGQNSSSISQTSPTNNIINNNSNSINNLNNINSNTIINNNNNQCNRKKTSSFQITSVTVGSRMSNDAGDDSNDDLDESHGEDTSVELSRIEQTDIETPSYSEDTFSKEDVFFNSSNTSIGTAPVIPTSSQYGLAIVSSENNNINNTNNDNNINTLDITSVTDNNIINLLSSNVKQDNDISIRDSVHGHGRNERFKVVKIESTEPFKRGRWTCMDYLDHTSVNNQTNVITTNKISDPNEVCISYGVTDAGFIPIDKLPNNQPSTTTIVAPSPLVVVGGGGTTTATSIAVVPTTTTTTTAATAAVVVPTTTTSSSSSQINDDINIDINGHNSIGPTSTNNNYNVTPQQHNQQQQQTGQQQLPQYYQCSHPSQQQQQQQQQAATLPTNLQSQHQNNLGQPQSMPQGTIPIMNQSNNNNNNNSNVNQHQNDVTLTSQNQTFQGQQNVCQSSSSSSSTTTPSTNIIVTQSASQPTSTNQQQQQQQSINQLIDNITTSIQQQQQQQPIQNIHQTTGTTVPTSSNGVVNTNIDPGNQVNQVSSTGQNQITTNGLNIGGSGGGGNSGGNGVVSSSSSNTGGTGGVNNSVNGNSNNITRNNFGVRFPQANYPSGILGKIGFTPSYTEQDSVGFAADAVLLECLAEVTQAAEDPKILENNENLSGIGAVAIDNKIEQAMDLVKSHLMYAVREEVHILKQKITELTDHINLLEAENTILKAHASPDILAQLNSSTTKLSQNNTTNGQ